MDAIRHIPLDIVCRIIDFTAKDRETLSQLALISQDSCAYANRYLWRSFSLTGYTFTTLSSLEERCQALIRDERRAGFVRQLGMAFYHQFDDTDMSIAIVGHMGASDGFIVPTTEPMERSIRKLFNLVAASVAACAPRLECLRIYGPYHLTDVGQALSRLVENPPPYYDTRYPSLSRPKFLGDPEMANTPTLSFPSLTHVVTECSYSHEIVPFFVLGCSSVRTWYIDRKECLENLPHNLFPALEEFQGGPTNLKNVTRGRRVRRITITTPISAWGEAAIQHLLDGLEAGAGSVLELSLSISLALLDSQDVEMMQDIARVAPFLRSLELVWFAMSSVTADNSPEKLDRFAQGLSVFQYLETLSWSGLHDPFWGTSFAKNCFKSSSALQRIRFNQQQIQRQGVMGKEFGSYK